jgi:hypothetical protein
MIGSKLNSLAIEVGNYILKEIFNDDIEEARSKNPHKDKSYRKLQDHPDLKIHYSHLNQMVGVAIQERYFLKNLAKENFENHLTYSHRIELLKVKESKNKIDLVNECVENKYSVRELREKVKGLLSVADSSKIDQSTKSLKYITKEYAMLKLLDNDFESLKPKKLEKKKNVAESINHEIKTIQEDLSEMIKNMDLALESKKKEKQKTSRQSTKKK